MGHQELAGLQKQRIYMRETQSQSFTHTKENLTHESRPSHSLNPISSQSLTVLFIYLFIAQQIVNPEVRATISLAVKILISAPRISFFVLEPKKRKKMETPGMGGRHAATTQGF